MVSPNVHETNEPLNGLVLTGGGARAAYQVGVLRAISAITKYQYNPFKIITGFSAGAINGSWLASRSENFDQVTESMWKAWAEIEMDHVFRTSSLSMATIGIEWIRDRLFNYSKKNHHISYLLNTSPLGDFLKKNIDFDALNANLNNPKHMHAFSIIAANYHTGQSTAFYAGDEKIKDWESLNRISVRTRIEAEHVMASSAIPIFFPPVQVGDYFYGDGMVRLTSPLSPALHMGSDRLMVIGIRGPSSLSQTQNIPKDTISIGEVAGTVLNGLFFDAVDTDVARMKKINERVSYTTKQELSKDPDPPRHIPLLVINPSEEIALEVKDELSRLPLTLAFSLRGLGITADRGQDLLSYLAFEPKYMKQLLELGYEDAMRKKTEILEFFESKTD